MANKNIIIQEFRQFIAKSGFKADYGTALDKMLEIADKNQLSEEDIALILAQDTATGSWLKNMVIGDRLKDIPDPPDF